MQRMWVAQAPLSQLIEEKLLKNSLSVRELADRAELDPRTCRDVLSGRGTSGFVPVETAEKILRACGALDEMSALEVFISA